MINKWISKRSRDVAGKFELHRNQGCITEKRNDRFTQIMWNLEISREIHLEFSKQESTGSCTFLPVDLSVNPLTKSLNWTIDWFWLPIFSTNLVRGPWNKAMKFQNKGAVLVQIALLLNSQPHNHNQSVSNTLQDTASCYNTMHHAETYCITLHHDAAHCNTLQHAATHCNTLRHTATHCN